MNKIILLILLIGFFTLIHAGCDTSCDEADSGTCLVPGTPNPAECTKCKVTTAGYKVLATSSTSTSGTCKNFDINFCASGKKPVQITGDMYYCQDMTTDYSNKKQCSTYQNTQPYIYATLNDLYTDCTSCTATGQILVVTAEADTKGYCVDISSTTGPSAVCTSPSYLKPVPASGTRSTECGGATTGTDKCAICTAFSSFGCATGNAVFQKSTTEFVYNCQALPTAASVNKQLCATYKQIPFDSTTVLLDQCISCSTNQILVVTASSDTQGYCASISASTSAICTTSNSFLKLIKETAGRSTVCGGTTTTTNYCAKCTDYSSFQCTGTEAIMTNTDNTFLYACKSPTASPKKACSSYTYLTQNTPISTEALALDQCLTCTAQQALIKSSATNTNGNCIDYTDINTFCSSNKFVLFDTSSTTKGVCTTANDNTVNKKYACTTFYYSATQLGYANENAALLNCVTCGSDKVVIKQNANDNFGSCTIYSDIQSVCGNNNFMKFDQTNSSPTAPIYSTTMGQCTVAADDTTTNAYKKCLTFYYSSGTSAILGYNTNALAILSCNTCDSGQYKTPATQQGYCKVSSSTTPTQQDCTDPQQLKYIVAPADTQFTCTSISNPARCTSYYYASGTVGYQNETTALTFCLGCLSGYNLNKVNTNTWGTCSSCGTSCSSCSSEGYYLKSATAGTTGTCTIFDTTSNCLLAYAGESYIDSTSASLKCIQCKSGFYPLNSTSSTYGQCTALTGSTNCIKFVNAAFTSETNANQGCQKCKANFYYILTPSGSSSAGGSCNLCPSNCLTCNAGPFTTSTDADQNCLSCQPGYGNLIKQSGQLYGRCIRGAKCFSASGIYSADTEECDICLAGYYFALTNNTLQGVCNVCSDTNCLICDVNVTNCLRCADGYYFNSAASACSPCISGCKYCTGGTVETCSQCIYGYSLTTTACVQCIANCKQCTTTAIDGCQICNSGYFKSTDSCAPCTTGCSTCNAGAATNCSVAYSSYYINQTIGVTSCFYDTTAIITSTKCSNCTNGNLETCNCRSGYYKGTTDCIQCYPNCNKCTGSGSSNCTEVYSGYYKDTTGSIIQCISGCDKCTSNAYSGCSQCSSGYYLNQTLQICARCHKACNSCTGSKVNQCQSCNSNQLGTQNIYVSMYVQLTTDADVAGICTICDASCKSCSGKTTKQNAKNACRECFGKQILVILQTDTGSGYCSTSCPSNYFLSTSVDGPSYCVKCTSPCNTCLASGDQKCLTCITGYTGGSTTGAPCVANPPASTITSSIKSTGAAFITISSLVLALCLLLF